MRRLLPLLLLLAACSSSKAASSSTPTVGASSSPASEAASAPPSAGSSSELPTPSSPTSQPSSATPSRPVPTHGASPSTKAPSAPSRAALAQPCAAGSLALTVTAVASGSNASFHATLTNHGSQTCTLTEGATTPGIVVTGNGTTVWSRGCDGSVSGHTGPLPCPEYERLQDLAAGASQSWTQDWDGTADGNPVKPAPPGAYTVTASAGGVTATAEFSLS